MRSTTALTLLIATASLSACGTPNQGLESVHQPVVSRTDYVFDVAAPLSGRFAEGEARRLSAWFESLQLHYGDHIAVDAPNAYGSRDAVAAVSAPYGMLVDTDAPVTRGDIPSGMVRVIVSRMTAAVPNCPDFSRPANPEFGGNRTSNYGCAINTNLAAMVADPRDLITGRNAPSSTDAAISGKAIRTYRNTIPTGSGGLKTESTKGN